MRRSYLLLATSVFAALALTPDEAKAQSVENRDGGSYGGNSGDNGGGYEQDGTDGTSGTAGGGGGAGTATTRGDGGAGSTGVGVGGVSTGGGAGGVGGINGITAATLSGLSIIGGGGGNGSPASTGTIRNGGGGGAGGYGYVLTTAGTHSTVAGQTIVGGVGGSGATGSGSSGSGNNTTNGRGGDGGDGGVGLFLQVGGGFTNVAGATLTGGAGGIDGAAPDGGSSGTGGTGLLTSGGGLRGFTISPRTGIFEPTFAATVSNAGTIAGGVGGANSGGTFFNSGQGGIGVHLLGIGTLTNSASGLITGGGGGAAFAGSPTLTATSGGFGGDGVTLGRAAAQGAENRTVVNEGRIQGGSGAAGATADPLSRPGDGGTDSRFNFVGGSGGTGVTAGLPFFGSLSGGGTAEIRYTITNAAAGVLAGGAGGVGGAGPVSDGATTTLAGSNGGDGGPGVKHLGEPGLEVGSNVHPSRFSNTFGCRTAVGNIVNQGRIVGGAGGQGGVVAGGPSGDPGNGGAGISVSGGTLTITNSGTIQGGDGAAGIVGGAAGLGGVGVDFISSNPIVVCPSTPDPIRGFACGAPLSQADVIIVYPNRANATIVNSGTIAGGLNGDGTRAPAIVFDAGVHTLTIQTGATFMGDVIVNPFTTRTIPANLTFGPLTISEGGNPADNTLNLDGASIWTVSLPQFINFGNLTQTGGAGGRWTLTGAGTFSVRGSVAAGTMVLDPASRLTTLVFTMLTGGTLSVSDPASLTGIGQLRLDGGTFQVTGRAIAAPPANFVFGDLGGGFDIADAGHNFTIAQALAGAGRLEKLGPGTLILTGANTYTGNTTVSQGVLQIGADGTSGSIAGNIANAATLVFNRSDALTFAGVLSGNGALTKTGAGTLTLSGNSSAYTGQTSVNAGTLLLTGSLGGTVTIGNGARLGGTGTLGNLIVTSGGILAPGTSPGTLTATGNVIFRAGSFYDVELTAAGGTDLIRAAGTATIEGGTVRVTALDPETSYADGSRYTILTATGGRTGTFAGLTESSAFLDFALSYDANNVIVTVDVIRMFPDVALTFNQRQASTALMGFNTVGGADGLAVYNALLMLDADPARVAFDSVSGEIYPVLVHAELRRSAGRSRNLLARANAGSGQGWGLWGSATAGDGRTDADGNGARFTQGAFGGALGVDYRGPGNDWALGAEFGYHQSNVTLRDRASEAESDGWHVGAYGRFGTGGAGFSAAVAGSFASSEADVNRTIAFGTLSRNASANVDLDSWALGGELRYGLAAGGGWSLGPQARIVHADAGLDAFAETGAGSLNLAGGDGSDDSRTRYGGGLFARWESERGFVDVSASYASGGESATEIGLVMTGAPNAPYRLRAARGDGDAAELTLAGGVDLGGGWSIGANAEAVFGGRERTLQGSATIGWRF